MSHPPFSSVLALPGTSTPTGAGRLVLVAAMLCGLAGPLRAQPATEHLLAPIPPTFELAAQPQHDGMTIKVYLPAGETTQNWTEQIVVQVILNKGGVGDPVGLLRTIEKGWIETCKQSTPEKILPGTTNGYPTATMLLACPRSAVTGKAETGLLHAIQGGDNFYLVQKNARYVPSQDQLREMMRYMATVSLCDDRSADHPCPNRQ